MSGIVSKLAGELVVGDCYLFEGEPFTVRTVSVESDGFVYLTSADADSIVDEQILRASGLVTLWK